jgi:hypothetical protein
VRATSRQSIWSVGLSCLSRSSNQINQTNQITQIDQIPATCHEMVSDDGSFPETQNVRVFLPHLVQG